MIESAMAKKIAGDYRNPEQVTAWAAGIADELIAEHSLDVGHGQGHEGETSSRK